MGSRTPHIRKAAAAIHRHLLDAPVAQTRTQVRAALALSHWSVDEALTLLRQDGRVEVLPDQRRPLLYRATGTDTPAPEHVRHVSAAAWERYLRQVLAYARRSDEALDRNALICRERNPLGPALLDRALRELADAGQLVRLGEVDGTPYYCTPEDAQ
jgi:hypothetical protein